MDNMKLIIDIMLLELVMEQDTGEKNKAAGLQRWPFN